MLFYAVIYALLLRKTWPFTLQYIPSFSIRYPLATLNIRAGAAK